MPALQMDKEISLSIKEVSPTDVFHHRLRDKNARMAELVDAVDSKSTDRNIVPVRVRLRVPLSYMRQGFTGILEFFPHYSPHLLLLNESTLRKIEQLPNPSV